MMYHPDRYAPHSIAGPGGASSDKFNIISLLAPQPVLEKPMRGAKVLQPEGQAYEDVASTETKDEVIKESWGSIVNEWHLISNYEFYSDTSNIDNARERGFPLGDGPEPQIECACKPVFSETHGWIKGTSYYIFDDGLELFKKLFPGKDPKNFQNPANLSGIIVPFNWTAYRYWEWSADSSGLGIEGGSDKPQLTELSKPKYKCPTWATDDAQIGILKSSQTERVEVINAMIDVYADMGKPTSTVGQQEVESGVKAAKSKRPSGRKGGIQVGKPKSEGGMGLLAVLGLAAVAYAASKK